MIGRQEDRAWRLRQESDVLPMSGQIEPAKPGPMASRPDRFPRVPQPLPDPPLHKSAGRARPFGRALPDPRELKAPESRGY